MLVLRHCRCAFFPRPGITEFACRPANIEGLEARVAVLDHLPPGVVVQLLGNLARAGIHDQPDAAQLIADDSVALAVLVHRFGHVGLVTVVVGGFQGVVWLQAGYGAQLAREHIEPHLHPATGYEGNWTASTVDRAQPAINIETIQEGRGIGDREWSSNVTLAPLLVVQQQARTQHSCRPINQVSNE